MLMMRALWGPPWRRKKLRKKKPFTGGTRGSAALASGPILLRRRPTASKAIPGTTRAKRSANARSLGTSRCPIYSAPAPQPVKRNHRVRVSGIHLQICSRLPAAKLPRRGVAQPRKRKAWERDLALSLRAQVQESSKRLSKLKTPRLCLTLCIQNAVEPLL